MDIVRRERGLKIIDREPDLCFKEKRVSPWSYFADSVWILSETHTIYWQRLPGKRKNVDLQAFESLMVPVKRLAYLILHEEELSAAVVYVTVQYIKLFACWMLSQAVPITRFSDVTDSDIRQYLEDFRLRPSTVRIRGRRRSGNGLVGTNTIRTHAFRLLRLYHYRQRIGDGLNDFQILLDLSPTLGREDFESKTEPIPDGDFQKLLAAAVRFVDEDAVRTIREFRRFIAKEGIREVHDALTELSNDDLTRRRRIKIAEEIRVALDRLKRGPGNKPIVIESFSPQTIALMINTNVGECAKCLRENRSLKQAFVARRKVSRPDTINWDGSDLHKNIRLLQTACFIIIAASTGMRRGELMSISPGCLIRRKKRGVTLYWVKARLSKTSVNRDGELASWLCGELAAKALSILEELHTVLPTATVIKAGLSTSRPDSLFRIYVWDAVTLEARPISQSTNVIQEPLSMFIKEMCLETGYIHPHQFRRSFARNIVRWTNAPILALQRHFKHWSLLMTDYYIGSDSQLMEMFYREQLEASKARLRQILSGQCGGPGGIILQKRLVKMLDMGELPKSFRGTKRETGIESLVNEISRDGVFAYKCSDFTTCLYVAGVAKCGEEGPKEHECHPTECVNSHILLEDVPFYLRNIAQNVRVYQQLSTAEQGGPLGSFLRMKISNDETAIRPLVRMYEQKLIATRNGLRSVGNHNAEALELRRQVDEEMEIVGGIVGGGWSKKQNGASASGLETTARGAHA